MRAKSADTNLRRKLMTESTPGDYLNSSSVAHTSGTMLPSTNVNTGASKNPRAKSVDKSASPSKRRPPPLRGFGLSPSPKTSGNGMSISFTGELLPDVPENQSDSAMGSDEGSRPIQQRSAGHQNVSSRSKCGGPTTHLQRQTYNTSATQSASGGSGNITDSGIFTSYVSETDSDNLMVASVTSVGGESIEAEGHDGDTELSDSDAMAGPLTEVLLSGVASQPAVNSRNVVPLAVVNGKTRFIPQPSKRESPSSCSSSDKEMTPPYKPPMEQ